jgi:hypothetical protein
MTTRFFSFWSSIFRRPSVNQVEELELPGRDGQQRIAQDHRLDVAKLLVDVQNVMRVGGARGIHEVVDGRHWLSAQERLGAVGRRKARGIVDCRSPDEQHRRQDQNLAPPDGIQQSIDEDLLRGVG